jgi:hypothetical protein
MAFKMKAFKIDESQELFPDKEDINLWILHINGVPQYQTPTSLFKYYSLSRYNLEAIRDSYLYLNNPSEFNDPFDCTFNLIEEKQIRPVDGHYVPSQNNVGNKGICCFSTVEDSPLMWPHYTNSYKGFAIRFKPDFGIHLDSRMENHRLMRVIYSQNPNKVSEKMPFANSYQLGVKLEHWSYEHEWRLIVDKKDNSFRRLRYPKDNVMEFIFGYRFFELMDKEEIDLRDELLEIIREKFPDVPKYKMGPDFESLSLKKMPLFEFKDIY